MPTPLELGRELVKLDEATLGRLLASAAPDELDAYEAAIAAVEAERRSSAWLTDPVRWAEEVLRFRLHAYQSDALAELAETGRLAIRAPHSTGKTRLAAVTLMWFCTTREAAGIGWKVPTTASVWRQLRYYLWPEVHAVAREIDFDALGRPPFSALEMQQMGLKLPHGEAFAMATNDPTAIEGAHARHLLFLFDESKAIPDPIFDAAEGAFAGAGSDTGAKAWALAISTPGAPEGRFYAICKGDRRFRHWRTRHITLNQAIEAGQISREWAETMARQWTPGSPIYANRVLGEFAASSSESIVPLAWVEVANERYYEALERGEGARYPTHAGLDVARYGDDENVLALVADDLVAPPIRPAQGDSIAVANSVLPYVGTSPTGPVVMVDADGVGAGVYDQLRLYPDLAARLRPFIAGEGTPWKDRTGMLTFGNTRAAAWWHVRDLLNPAYSPTLALPPDDLLTGDLTAPKWHERNDRVYVESKEQIRKRLKRSTDTGDAVVMALWGRVVGLLAVVDPASHRWRGITGDLMDIGF